MGWVSPELVDSAGPFWRTGPRSAKDLTVVEGWLSKRWMVVRWWWVWISAFPTSRIRRGLTLTISKPTSSKAMQVVPECVHAVIAGFAAEGDIQRKDGLFHMLDQHADLRGLQS